MDECQTSFAAELHPLIITWQECHKLLVMKPSIHVHVLVVVVSLCINFDSNCTLRIKLQCITIVPAVVDSSCNIALTMKYCAYTED